MANHYGVNNAVYLPADAWSMAQYGANTAATFTPLRAQLDPVIAPGHWLGTRRKIFFMEIYQDERGDAFESKFTPLLKLANQSDDLNSEELFNVYVNIIRFICPGKDHSIRNVFVTKGYDVVMLNTVQTKAWYHNMKLRIRELSDEDLAQLTPADRETITTAQAANANRILAADGGTADDEQNIPPPVLNAVLGVYFNLITKKITTLNLDNWYKGRIRAYSRNTQSDYEEAVYNNIRPSVKFAESVSSGVAGCFKFKRTVFTTIRELANVEDHPSL